MKLTSFYIGIEFASTAARCAAAVTSLMPHTRCPENIQ